MNRHDIIQEMRVLSEIDPQAEIDRRIHFIKTRLLNAGCKTLVLGISGGVDSSTCGRLAQLAVEQLNSEKNTGEYQFVAVRLPYGVQMDEADAQVALRFIQPSQSLTVNIKNMPLIKPAVANNVAVNNKVRIKINILCTWTSTKNIDTVVTMTPIINARATPPPTKPAIMTHVGTGDTINSSILR